MDSSLAEKIYNKSPLWLQNLLISAKGYQFKKQRFDKNIIQKQLDFLMKSQFWSEEQFRHYQVEKLRQLLNLAFTKVPYYKELQRKLGCKIEDFQHLEDIRYLPVLEKHMLRENINIFLNDSFNLKYCLQGSTSGTTGSPLRLYESKETLSLDMAFIVRMRIWAGLRNAFQPRSARFTGRNIIPSNQNHECHIYWRYNFPGNSLLLSSSHISEETVPFYIDALNKFKPEIIEGYPSSVLVISRISKRLNLKLPSPQAIFVTGETFLEEHRRELEENFQCRIFNQYAASEPTCFWCDCEYGVMHESPEYGISELLDNLGNPVEQGDSGEVVVTSFLNNVLLLIRYKVGDIAVRSDKERCICGRMMPQIKKIEGRIDDTLYIPGKGYIARFGTVFRDMSNIVEAQIIHEEMNYIKVLLVPNTGYNELTEKKLIENLRVKLGKEVSLKIEKTNKIPRGKNGKFRMILSKIKHMYPDNVQQYK